MHTPRTLLTFLFIPFMTSVLILCGSAQVQAQAIDTVGPRMITDPVLVEKVHGIINRFYEFGNHENGIHDDSISNYAIDEFAELLLEYKGRTFWPYLQKYSIGNIYAIRPEESILMVTTRTTIDSIPLYGQLGVDWIWFVRLNEEGEWRISSMKRTQGLEKVIETLYYIDTTSIYPAILKGEIARAEGGMLMDNAQMIESYNAHRQALQRLVKLIEANDSIKLLERDGDHIRQFNFNLVEWEMAAQTITPEIVEVFLEGADEILKKEIEQRLRVAEKQRLNATNALNQLAKKAKVNPADLDTIAALMKEGRIKFVNAELPIEKAILLTIDGQLEEAIGYLYSPGGRLPYISPEEFFYLEKVDENWWIFRAK